MTRPQPHKIFISSTYLDLSEVRSEIARWLSGIFGTEFIIMETFGSDADPPDVYSVRRVGECNLFIGIYANRYGTIDKDTVFFCTLLMRIPIGKKNTRKRVRLHKLVFSV
jgi:hypothetical protein